MSYPLQLRNSFIGIELKESDYLKVEGMLPTPTHKQIITSTYSENNINLIYKIKYPISTVKQHQYLSDIKIGLQNHLFIDFIFIDEFFIKTDTESSGAIYTLDELKTAFKAKYITYPKFVLPNTKKELYRCLIWFGSKLYYQKILNRNALIATALKMNSKLKEFDRYSHKDILKKAESVYIYINENKDERFKLQLEPKQLKEALTKGGKTRGKQISKESKRQSNKIKKLLTKREFLKVNGKPNISKIAKELSIRRETIYRHLTHITNS